MIGMATLHIMVGLPASGKTTLAKRLEAEHNALRFTPDEWQLRLFGQDASDKDHDRRHDEIERIMLELTARALDVGIDVVQDYGLWARCQRDEMKQFAVAHGAKWELHVMEPDKAELMKRLHQRNENLPEGAFYITDAMMHEFIGIYQPVEPDEFE